jgi:salicylate 5-hydroxylase small subunit
MIAHNIVTTEEMLALIQLNAEYAACVDDKANWERWPDFFLDECVYKLQPRENFDRGLPLATLSFESRGMLKDRLYGIRETLFHDPYYQRHVIGMPRVTGRDGGRIRCETNYAVFRTKQNEVSEVFNVGRYMDEIVLTKDGPRFASRLCVFDSEMIPNSIIYPI